MLSYYCAISFSILSCAAHRSGPPVPFGHWASYARRTWFRGLLLISALLFFLFINPSSIINPGFAALSCSRLSHITLVLVLTPAFLPLNPAIGQSTCLYSVGESRRRHRNWENSVDSSAILVAVSASPGLPHLSC